MGVAQIEPEVMIVASDQTEAVIFREKAASDANVACVITDLEVQDASNNCSAEQVMSPVQEVLVLRPEDGQGAMTDAPFDVALSPIEKAKGWKDAPEDALEFTMLFSKGQVHRNALLLKGDSGVYDHIAIYKNKKADEPIVVLQNNVFTECVVDDALKNEQKYTVSRNMRALTIEPDGSKAVSYTHLCRHRQPML